MNVAESATASGVIEGLYDAGVEPGAMSNALRKLADHVGAHTAMVILTDAAHCGASGFLSSGSDPRLISAETMGRAPDNPWTRATLRHPPGTLLLTDRLVPQAELRRSPFFEEVVRPYRIEHGMGGVFHVDGDTSVFLVAHRSAREGPFEQRAVARFRELIPHLKRSCRLMACMAAARVSQEATLAAFHWLRVAVVVVSRDRHVRFANRSAERAFETGSALTVKGERLVAHGAGKTEELERMVVAAVERRHPAGATLHCRKHGRQIEVMVMPMSVAATVPWTAAPAALVMFRNPDERPEGLEALLEQLYRLTPTEARVTRAIVRGQGLKQSAESLGIRLSTARTHLYRVFEKTGTRRQAELVRLILDGPALLSGLD